VYSRFAKQCTVYAKQLALPNLQKLQFLGEQQLVPHAFLEEYIYVYYTIYVLIFHLKYWVYIATSAWHKDIDWCNVIEKDRPRPIF
jgi:hypothetical protein